MAVTYLREDPTNLVYFGTVLLPLLASCNAIELTCTKNIYSQCNVSKQSDKKARGILCDMYL
jgi:hypothetical protein